MFSFLLVMVKLLSHYMTMSLFGFRILKIRCKCISLGIVIIDCRCTRKVKERKEKELYFIYHQHIFPSKYSRDRILRTDKLDKTCKPYAISKMLFTVTDEITLQKNVNSCITHSKSSKFPSSFCCRLCLILKQWWIRGGGGGGRVDRGPSPFSDFFFFFAHHLWARHNVFLRG